MFPKNLAGSLELLLLEDMLHRSPEVCRSIGTCQDLMKIQSQGQLVINSNLCRRLSKLLIRGDQKRVKYLSLVGCRGGGG